MPLTNRQKSGSSLGAISTLYGKAVRAAYTSTTCVAQPCYNGIASVVSTAAYLPVCGISVIIHARRELRKARQIAFGNLDALEQNLDIDRLEDAVPESLIAVKRGDGARMSDIIRRWSGDTEVPIAIWIPLFVHHAFLSFASSHARSTEVVSAIDAAMRAADECADLRAIEIVQFINRAITQLAVTDYIQADVDVLTEAATSTLDVGYTQIDSHVVLHLSGMCALRLYEITQNTAHLAIASHISSQLHTSWGVELYRTMWLDNHHLLLAVLPLAAALPGHINKLGAQFQTKEKIIAKHKKFDAITKRVAELTVQKRRGVLPRDVPLVLWISAVTADLRYLRYQILEGIVEGELEVVTVRQADPRNKGYTEIIDAMARQPEYVVVFDEYDRQPHIDIKDVLLPAFAEVHPPRPTNAGAADAIFIITTVDEEEELDRATEYAFHCSQTRSADCSSVARRLHRWGRDTMANSGCVVYWSPEDGQRLSTKFYVDASYLGDRLVNYCTKKLDLAKEAYASAPQQAAIVQQIVGREVYILSWNEVEGFTAKHVSEVLRTEAQLDAFIAKYRQQQGYYLY